MSDLDLNGKKATVVYTTMRNTTKNFLLCNLYNSFNSSTASSEQTIVAFLAFIQSPAIAPEWSGSVWFTTIYFIFSKSVNVPRLSTNSLPYIISTVSITVGFSEAMK